MVETPAPLHASHRIDRTGESDEDRQNEKRIGVDYREPGDQQCKPEAKENQENSTEKRSPARIEKARLHAILTNVTLNSMLPFSYFGAAGAIASAGTAAGEAAAGRVTGGSLLTSAVATSTTP